MKITPKKNKYHIQIGGKQKGKIISTETKSDVGLVLSSGDGCEYKKGDEIFFEGHKVVVTLIRGEKVYTIDESFVEGKVE